MSALRWFVVRESDGTPHTKCPHCGGQDSIYEVDKAVRWNRLNLSADGTTATAATGDADFES